MYEFGGPGDTRPAPAKKVVMKVYTLNLAALAALSGFLVSSGISSAQTTNSASPAPRRGPTIEQRVQRLTTELKLNEDQKANLTALFQKEAVQRREIFTDRNMSREERRDKMRALMQEQNKQMKLIFTPEQFEKWKTIRAELRPRRPRPPGGSGEPAPAPAPPPTSAPGAGAGNSQAQ